MAKEPLQMTAEVPSPESGSIELDSLGVPKDDDTPVPKPNLTHRIIDGFRRDPNLLCTPKGVVGANGKVFDVEAAAKATAESPLARKLKGRHLQMIAIGGSIGWFIVGIEYLRYLYAHRYRSLRRLREVSLEWWSGVDFDRIQPHRLHVVLHCPGSG